MSPSRQAVEAYSSSVQRARSECIWLHLGMTGAVIEKAEDQNAFRLLDATELRDLCHRYNDILNAGLTNGYALAYEYEDNDCVFIDNLAVATIWFRARWRHTLCFASIARHLKHTYLQENRGLTHHAYNVAPYEPSLTSTRTTIACSELDP